MVSLPCVTGSKDPADAFLFYQPPIGIRPIIRTQPSLLPSGGYPVRIATVHLLRSSANAAHLQRSLEQSERGQWLQPALIKPGQAGAGS